MIAMNRDRKATPEEVAALAGGPADLRAENI